MRFKINGKWKNGYTNDGILFFAQRIEEMLMYYTSHIYKVPVYNTYLLIEEYASTAQLVRQKAVNQTHLSLILEEFYSQLSSDVVIKDHYSQDEIDHFIGRLRGCSIEEQGRIMHYLWHIMGQYPEWCKETIKKCVASPKEKK